MNNIQSLFFKYKNSIFWYLFQAMKNTFLTFLFFLLLLSCQKDKAGQKQFSLLSSQKTNISFSNNIIENDSLNYFTYPYMYMGGGISAGDINNDGLTDLFFTANQKSNELYLNKGNFKFENITQKANIAGDDRWFTGTTMVDINNDGYLDIYVSVSGKSEKRNNLLYINNGDLTFTEIAKEYGINNNGHTTQSTFFDYDNDGDLDLYLANYPPTKFNSPVDLYAYRMKNPKIEASDILYSNNGDGTFTDVTIDSGILNFGLALSATAGDFNNDGWQDVYVSNDFDSPDFLYLNQKDGTFKEISQSVLNHTSQYGMGVDVSDYNNDNLLDIAEVDMTPEDNRRSKANMSSMNPISFTKMVNYGLYYQYMQNSLQLNRGTDHNGNIKFSEVSRIAGISTTDWSWAILFSDLDNDGWKDIIISNGTRRDINNRDYFKKLSQQLKFGGKIKFEEVKKIPSEKISNYIYKNGENHTFMNVVDTWGVNEKTFSNGAVYADLDNDGDLDMIFNNIDEIASVYKNNNIEENNFINIKLKGSQKNILGLGTRVYIETNGLNQMQELTLTRGFQSSIAPEIHFGLKKIDTINTIKVLWPDGKTSILKNTKANQTITIDYTKSTNAKREKPIHKKLFKTISQDSINVDFRHTENKFDDYINEPLLPHQTSMLGSGVAVADVNGDGFDDFYIGGAARQSGALYMQNAEGKFKKTNESLLDKDKEAEDMSALFFDADSDGDNDLYVVSGGNEFKTNSSLLQDRLYLNDGNGKFTKTQNSLPIMLTSGSRAKPADFDNDGDLDLFVGGRLTPGKYPWPTKSYILKNNNGIFEDITKQVAPNLENIGMVTDALWTDFNNDSSLDLIIVGEWMPISFFSNQNGKFKNISSATGIENSEGWWFSIAQEDFDNDGDMDYVVGNLGLNYKYQATTKEPFEVFADDFDNNNRKDIVLSYYNFGKLFPVRGRSCSSQQIPSISTKFENYNSFSVADVEEVYGSEELKNAEIHYKAKNFATSYIENLGNGKFKISNLPNEAQFSSVNKILITDIDGDNYKDIIIAGNLYSSEIETPRNDSAIGLYLRNDGKGNFIPISAYENGLFITGDVKDLSFLNINNKKNIIAVKNNEAPQFVEILNKPL